MISFFSILKNEMLGIHANWSQNKSHSFDLRDLNQIIVIEKIS